VRFSRKGPLPQRAGNREKGKGRTGEKRPFMNNTKKGQNLPKGVINPPQGACIVANLSPWRKLRKPTKLRTGVGRDFCFLPVNLVPGKNHIWRLRFQSRRAALKSSIGVVPFGGITGDFECCSSIALDVKRSAFSSTSSVECRHHETVWLSAGIAGNTSPKNFPCNIDVYEKLWRGRHPAKFV